jgi:hypothetical protein
MHLLIASESVGFESATYELFANFEQDKKSADQFVPPHIFLSVLSDHAG